MSARPERRFGERHRWRFIRMGKDGRRRFLIPRRTVTIQKLRRLADTKKTGPG